MLLRLLIGLCCLSGHLAVGINRGILRESDGRRQRDRHTRGGREPNAAPPPGRQNVHPASLYRRPIAVPGLERDPGSA